MKKWWVAWVALAVLVFVAGAVLVARSRPSPSPSARAARLSSELACPVCTGESVADSNAPESRAMRLDIAERITKGQSDAQIRAAYVAIYGEHVLLTPSNGGLGVVAWGLPVLALVLGAGGIAFAIRRGSRTPRLAATADDVALVDRERARHPDDVADEAGLA